MPRCTVLPEGEKAQVFLRDGRVVIRVPMKLRRVSAVGLERSYVARVLNLALLAPDLVEAVLFGDAPTGLSLARLRDDFPVEWVRQRITLGLQ